MRRMARCSFGLALLAALVSCSGDDDAPIEDLPAPKVFAVTPPEGALEGGTLLTLDGEGFVPGVVVRIGERYSPEANVLDENTLTCLSPPGAALGAVDVEVRNREGETGRMAGGFTYIDRPWFHAGAPFRRAVTIAGSTAGPQTSYQVSLTVPYDDDMEADFADLRFTLRTASGEQAVSHWFETVTASVEAQVWLRVPSIPQAPGEATVFLYYGDPAAAGGPSFDAVFTRDFGEGGLEGLWHLDEGAGSVAKDDSGHGAAAWLSGFSSPFGWQGDDGGRWGTREDVRFSTGSHLVLDGIASEVNAGMGVDTSGWSEISVEAWVRDDVSAGLGRGSPAAGRWASNVDLSTGWEMFNRSSNPGGFEGAVFDGRYVYFVPSYDHDGSQYIGEVVRYDTRGGFHDVASWISFDPSGQPGQAELKGYAGGCFDGRYVYFAPYHNSAAYHANILRYDTQGAFSDAGSWQDYDAVTASAVSPLAVGFKGAVFDGRYVYFVPLRDHTSYHGVVLRYDTHGDFDHEDAWVSYNTVYRNVGTDTRGYYGAVFDGRYVYFSPYKNSTGYNGEVLRYDTFGNFTTKSSWDAFIPGATSGVTGLQGYLGGCFDGRYVYFAPYANDAEYHGKALRYDTRRDFKSLSSWSAFDASTAGIGGDPTGYQGACFDGRYVYYVPLFHNGAHHGEVLRYDTHGDFMAASSWGRLDLATTLHPWAIGYRGAVFDGRHLILVPDLFSPGDTNKRIVRLDTTAPGSTFLLEASAADRAGGFSGGPFGPTARLVTTGGTASVSANLLSPFADWHHLAMTYDGASLDLYVDGCLDGSTTLTGSLPASALDVMLGAFQRGPRLEGALDEVRIYSRALTAGEIAAHAQRRKYADSTPFASAPGAEEAR